MVRGDSAAYIQTAIRFPAQWIHELQAIAVRLSRPGIPVTQADAMRAAMAEGIAKLRADLNITVTPAMAATREAIEHRIDDAPRKSPARRGKGRK